MKTMTLFLFKIWNQMSLLVFNTNHTNFNLNYLHDDFCCCIFLQNFPKFERANLQYAHGLVTVLIYACINKKYSLNSMVCLSHLGKPMSKCLSWFHKYSITPVICHLWEQGYGWNAKKVGLSKNSNLLNIFIVNSSVWYISYPIFSNTAYYLNAYILLNA